MRTIAIVLALMLVACGNVGEPEVRTADGKVLSEKEATMAKLSVEANKEEKDPVLAGIKRVQENERRMLRLKIDRGYKPTAEERAFLAGRERAVTAEQRQQQMRDRVKFNNDASARAREAMKKAGVKFETASATPGVN